MKKLMILIVMVLFILVNTSFTVAAEEEVIKLPPPQKDGGMPLMKALNLRKSTRGDFGPYKKLSMQKLSNLLWAADGINADGIIRKGNYRTAPSAVNWQNIDIYVTTADGLYLYDVENHALIVLGKKDVRSVSGQQDFVNNAPVNLIYIADYAKAKLGGRGEVMPTAEPWSYVGVGAIAQNVYLWCASENMASIVRAMVDKEAIRKTLKLREDQHVMLAHTIAHFKK